MSRQHELTGNDYVSLPNIGADGAIHGITVVSGRLGGLVEWHGDDEPLLRLRIAVDGTELDLRQAKWRRLDRWIPVWSLTLPDGTTLSATYCAPGGYPPARGFFIRLDVDNRGRAPIDVSLGLEVTWSSTDLIIASRRGIEAAETLVYDTDGTAILLESRAGAALAIGGGPATRRTGSDDDADAWPMRGGLSQSATVRANGRGTITFTAGAGRERDGALKALRGIQRHSTDHWLRQARLELSYVLRSAQDHRWAEALNRNLLFNRYYSVGRAIDDDLLYVMRSRSPLCPEPAVLNEREALFWTLPALALADAGLAREAMFRVFELASERSGEFERYIDGGAFDSSFCLDQMLLYTWAVDHYVRVTGDESVRDDPLPTHIAVETDAAVFMRLHPEHLLAVTELLPSGEPADYPFATMANVLLWNFCDRLGRQPPGSPDEPPLRFSGAAAEVGAAIWRQCVTDIGGEPVLVSSTDLDGAAAVYDDPAFSLALVPFFGLCGDDDPVWRSTVEFLRSDRYPLWRNGRVPGLAARTDPARARLSALCADLIVNLKDPLPRLAGLDLPGGVAAAFYDPATGECSAPHHAALAGFLAWSLVRVAEPPRKTKVSGRTRRP